MSTHAIVVKLDRIQVKFLQLGLIDEHIYNRLAHLRKSSLNYQFNSQNCLVSVQKLVL